MELSINTPQARSDTQTKLVAAPDYREIVGKDIETSDTHAGSLGHFYTAYLTGRLIIIEGREVRKYPDYKCSD